MAAPVDIATVRQVLGTDARTGADAARSPWELAAERLGPGSFDLVASLLTDAELGYDAANTLLVLDRDRGLAAVLLAAPKADRNVQHVGFFEVERRTFESGVVPLRAEAHAAALGVMALPDPHADALEEALRVAGASGSAADVPLLLPFLAWTHPVPTWQDRVRHAALGALARDGHAAAIEEIRTALTSAAADLEPDLARARAIDAYVVDAERSASPTLAPALCALLAYPVPAPVGHALPPSVGSSAASALAACVPPGPGVPPRPAPGDLGAALSPDLAAWTAWCAGRR